MTSRIQILFFTTLLLSCSLGDQHPRQKRGIAKMMMHMMWDPVRLIRYWHAYDVTKEIAKSWRKIIPTMVLYPYLGDAPGVAKYMNPTYGLLTKSSKKQTGQFRYPDEHVTYGQSWMDHQDHSSPGGGYSYSHTQTDHSANDYEKSVGGYALHHQEQYEKPPKTHQIKYGDRLLGSQNHLESASSSVNSRPVIFRPGIEMGPSLGNSGSNDVFALVNPHGPKTAHHGYLRPVVHREFKRDNRGRIPVEDTSSGEGQNSVESLMPLPVPYHFGNDREQHIIIKAMPMPEFDSSVEVEQTASSILDDTKLGNNHLDKQYHTPRHPGWVRIHPHSNLQSEIPIPIEGGRQEIHIVLHPIPYTESNNKGSEGQAVHFIPYNFKTDVSTEPKNDHFSIALPSIVPSSQEDNDSAPAESQIKSAQNESQPDNKTSSSSTEDVYDARQTSRVTWVLKTDQKSSEKSDETFAKSSSEDDANQYPLRLKGQKIDIKQLREDLKHGTPVLIPFDKKAKLQPNTENIRNSLKGGPMAGPNDPNRKSIKDGHETTLSNVVTSAYQNPEESRHYSSVEFADNNSTQRLLLFLAKKPTS